MSIKNRLERLESQQGVEKWTPTKLSPQISPEAWKALFSDSDIGMAMDCEQMAEWAVKNGY
ncbi:MAG: hypothetical protein ABL925_19665 [Methylococcales bacterium]